MAHSRDGNHNSKDLRTSTVRRRSAALLLGRSCNHVHPAGLSPPIGAATSRAVERQRTGRALPGSKAPFPRAWQARVPGARRWLFGGGQLRRRTQERGCRTSGCRGKAQGRQASEFAGRPQTVRSTSVTMREGAAGARGVQTCVRALASDKIKRVKFLHDDSQSVA